MVTAGVDTPAVTYFYYSCIILNYIKLIVLQL